MNAKRSDASVLIVGAGPAGLEAAHALGKRGYRVTLADARTQLGGRLPREAALPGMSEYIRVRDYRAQQFHKLPNVEVFLDSHLTAKNVMEFGADHVAVATGATWRKDRFDGEKYVDIAPPGSSPQILTPDDIMDGTLPEGPTLVYDEDGYYMGGVIAEKIKAAGIDVTLCTPSETVSAWAGKTSERWRIRTHLMTLGVRLELAQALTAFDGRVATLECQFTGGETQMATACVVMVTQRSPNDALYHDTLAQVGGDPKALPFSLTRIGDCEAPSIVAGATYSGHRYARTLEEDVDIDQPLKHDRVDVGTDASANPQPDVSEKYLETLLLYYEEEIEGEAYFASIADRLPGPAQKHVFMLLSEVETYTATAMRALIDKYGLTPRAKDDLHATGRAQAADATADWDNLIAEMRETFPGYITDFERLEAMAPAEDLPGLRVATAHEVAAVDFLNREVANDPDSTAPLRHFLKTGAA